jgi:penicillin-binding protein 1C
VVEQKDKMAMGLHPTQRRRQRRRIISILLVLIALSGGGCSSLDIGPRPASDPLVAVEAYLQLYQPGPLPRLFQTTRIYDRNGTLLAELAEEGDRRWVALDQLSPHLVHATLATEDATFHANTGIDPRRILGAAFQSFESGQIVSGASTITMQLARNLFLGPDQRYDQSMDRKILEAGVAQELTRQFSKDELLEMYLNLLNYGSGFYGPEAAAQGYFGKPAAELNLAEATLLAGIPQQPANLNLFTHFDAAKRRQRIVVDLMARHGYLTPEGADAVHAQPVALHPDPNRPALRAPHFVQHVIETLDAQLGDGYTRRAGLSIITTLDLPTQEMAQTLVQQTVAELRPQYDMNNAALVSLKVGSGEILVMVGSADFFDVGIAGQVNVATSPRQPGSAIKPLLFATALDDGLISPASVLWDTPISYELPDGSVYAPHNYDRNVHGPVTVRSALANSYNIPAVKLLAWVGVPRMLETARAMGLRSLAQSADWYGLSLAVGGGEVRLLDLTAAYHTLANTGHYIAPRAFLSITDNRGRQLLETPNEARQVLGEDAAFLVTHILSDAEARRPAFGEAPTLRLSHPAAVKTGTTDAWRDNQTVGYTPLLVTGVWVGNTDGSPTRLSTGLSGAAPIWHGFMQNALADVDLLARLGFPVDPAAWSFAPPDSVVQMEACPPHVRCPNEGEYFSRAWLDNMGDAGPLADSVLICPEQGDPPLAALKLPGVARFAQIDASSAAESTEPTELDEQKRQEQEAALAWSRAHGVLVTTGGCDQLLR